MLNFLRTHLYSMVQPIPSFRIVLISALVLTFAVTPSYADDTEVFFGQSNSSNTVNPNILFLLDVSGSMNLKDGGTVSRIDKLKSAMHTLLDQSTGFNVGIATFQGSNGGGAIRYPVKDLDTVALDVCPDGVCPDETIKVRPVEDTDDAYQNDESLVVTVDDDNLAMGAVYVDASGAPILNGNTDTTSGSSAVKLSRNRLVGSSVVEIADVETGELTWKNNQLTDDWFYENPTSREPFFGYQFDAIAIRRGAKIISAEIVFKTTGEEDQAGEVSARIYADQNANPFPLPSQQAVNSQDSTVPSLIDRSEPGLRTNAIVAWDLIPGTAENPAENDTLVTPNLAEIVQELVDLPTWKKWNAISFSIAPSDNYDANENNIRKIYSQGAISALQPVLRITFEANGSVIETTVSESDSHVEQFSIQNTQALYQNTVNPVSTLFHVNPGIEPRYLALRFPDIDIPKGSVIASANLRLRTTDQSEAIDPTITGLASTAGSSSSLSDFSININAELNADPESVPQTIPIKNREYTEDFISWTNIPDTENIDITSPNIAPVIENIIKLDDWEEGKTISLVLSAPGDYSNVPDNIRHILTSASAVKPVLEISWENIDGDLQDNLEPHTTAIRFRNVHVPQGAIIKGAELVMHASNPNGEEASFDISGELIANSQAFSTDNNDIGSRDRTQSRGTWLMEPWVAAGNPYSSVDVSGIVKEIVDQEAWCGGNPLSLFIGGTGQRFAQSVENNPTQAPTLEIRYEPGNAPTGGHCSNSTQVVSATDTTDDAAQNLVTGAMTVNNAYLSTVRSVNSTDKHAIGLRFRGVQLPPDAIITSATIEVTADSAMNDSINATIAIENSGNANAYHTSTADGNIQGRTYGKSVNWKSNRNAVAGDNIFTSDVSELLNDAISHPNWTQGNAVAFKITSNGGALDIVSYDGDEAASPRLIVYFQTRTEDAKALNRLVIQQTVDDIIAKGKTPIVGSLFESYNYFSGNDLDYGTERGTTKLDDHFFRVSHPESYEGGELHRPEGCSDDNLNSENCQGEQILTRAIPATYISPIESECQTNHIVLLSDGVASGENARTRVEKLIGQACDSSIDLDERCGAELSHWLANNDLSPGIAGQQTVTTHTIAFKLKETEFLESIALNSGGLFKSAEESSDLLLAFKAIFNSVTKTNASFVAPSASVSRFNRLRNNTDVFYGMFKPTGSARWPGNLKKYKVGVDADNEFLILDANGNPAVNENTGEFSSDSRSFWSSDADGDQVEQGGASEQLPSSFNSYLDRNVYTFTGTSRDLTHSTNAFSSSNTAIKTNLLNLPTAIAADGDQVEELIDWSAGRDTLDEDSDNNTDEVRNHIGDPMHATPVVVNYPNNESVVYVATNEGFLHAIDTSDGSEHFSFIPEELYNNLYKFYRNEPTTNHPYGLDGGKMVWHDDTNNDGLIDSDETAILYIAMRRGGDSYYALDISDYTKPKYLWSIKGGVITSEGTGTNTTKAVGDYTELASTWSLPVKTKIVDGNTVKDVIIFGGGYDQNQDPTDGSVVVSATGEFEEAVQVRTPDSIGRAIFIADAITGELVWKTSLTDPLFNDMQYSIPSQVRSIDINFDGIIDQLYVGDMGGQIWRMDFNSDTSTSNSIDSRITAGVIGEFAGDTPKSNRRFYYPPDVSVIGVDGQQVLSIAIGSGWRAHPLDDIVEDRFYSLRSPFVFGPPIDSFGLINYLSVNENSQNMIDVTDDIDAEVGASDSGWYLRLENNGEKVISSSLTFNGQIALTSYSPEAAANSCSALLGTSRIYALNVHNGAPILNLDEQGSETDLTENDRSRLLANTSLSTEISILFPDIETNDNPLFQVGKETIDELDGGNSRKASFWQEVTEGHDE